MSNQDFLRRMPKTGIGFRRRDRIAQRFHIDFMLLFLLLGISSFGLLVLYSASSSSILAVQKQGTFFAIAFTAMFVVAQIRVPPLQLGEVFRDHMRCQVLPDGLVHSDLHELFAHDFARVVLRLVIGRHRCP